VLYSLRHTFATRIAPHVDAWTLCKIMGWETLSVAMNLRARERKTGAGGFQWSCFWSCCRRRENA
jgi:hypothetical protein